jgi:hypothetical protein
MEKVQEAKSLMTNVQGGADLPLDISNALAKDYYEGLANAVAAKHKMDVSSLAGIASALHLSIIIGVLGLGAVTAVYFIGPVIVVPSLAVGVGVNKLCVVGLPILGITGLKATVATKVITVVSIGATAATIRNLRTPELSNTNFSNKENTENIDHAGD